MLWDMMEESNAQWLVPHADRHIPRGVSDASTSTTQSMFMNKFHLRPNKRSEQVGQHRPSSHRLFQQFCTV